MLWCKDTASFRRENNIFANMTFCFGFKKTSREISTAGGEVVYSFFQKFILQTKFRSKTSSVLK